MHLRILGAHNIESIDTRMESHLIDGVLALDAGGLTRALSFEEQRGIRSVMVSYRHFDHVRDLYPLGINREAPVSLWACVEALGTLRSLSFNGRPQPIFSVTPDLMSVPSTWSVTSRTICSTISFSLRLSMSGGWAAAT